MAKKKSQVEELDLDLELEDELELDEDLELDDELELDEDLELEEGEEEIEVDEDEEEEDEEEEIEVEDDDLELEEEEEEEEDDEDDIDLEIEEEEEEEEKPKKSSGKKPAVKAAVPAKKTSSAKASTATKGKTKKVVEKTAKTYEDLFEEVQEKVDNYDSIMAQRAEGTSTAIPTSTVISKELFLSLLAAKSSEEDQYLKTTLQKVMTRMGYDKDEVTEEVEKFSFARVDLEPVLGLLTDVLYEVLNVGGGYAMFKTEDCNFQMKGEWVKGKISENTHLNTDKASKIEPYLAIKTKSPAPKNKKTTGKIIKGKFVPIVEEKKEPTKKTAPAKKTGKTKIKKK